MLISLVSQALEDLHHGVGDGLDHFVVMVAEGHLNIQTNKLGQVTVGVGVLGPENWNDADLISMS